jgi:pyrimidine operon attenuation protein/uracil phosphoribosyltransferase
MDVSKLSLDDLISDMAARVDERIRSFAEQTPVMVGIHTGGLWIAAAMRERMQTEIPLGELNIAFYRDDFSRIGMHPHVSPSNLPFEVEDRHIILVDDVLYTGRTIRAAMNELFDYGRPARITLAVLIDRGGRELPMHADICGKTLSLKAGEHVKLSGPEPLALVVKENG